jgi:hypothetical protein
LILFDKKLKHGGEYRLKYVFHPLGEKAVNRPEVRMLPSG